jgi:hypothetical protein
MAELISKDIVDLQDIEKVQFLQTLQADPTKYAAYVQDKQGRIVNEVVDMKRASFVKTAGDMARLLDMDHNSMAALYRTNDLAASQDFVLKQQSSMISSAQSNADMTRRQVEINNWYYENKRETLFVLQIILLVMLMCVIILTVTSYGYISEAGSDYLLGFVIVVGAGIWMYRWYYTSRIRDPRFWNRRVFEEDGKIHPKGAECPPVPGEDDVPALGPGGQQQHQLLGGGGAGLAPTA